MAKGMPQEEYRPREKLVLRFKPPGGKVLPGFHQRAFLGGKGVAISGIAQLS